MIENRQEPKEIWNIESKRCTKANYTSGIVFKHMYATVEKNEEQLWQTEKIEYEEAKKVRQRRKAEQRGRKIEQKKVNET